MNGYEICFDVQSYDVFWLNSYLGSKPYYSWSAFTTDYEINMINID